MVILAKGMGFPFFVDIYSFVILFCSDLCSLRMIYDPLIVYTIISFFNGILFMKKWSCSLSRLALPLPLSTFSLGVTESPTLSSLNAAYLTTNSSKSPAQIS